MGKGYNNYMCKKPFHPGSKANIKRAWMAEQKTENEKKKQEELKVQYEKEQELYNNRSLLSTESKDKLELNFMYQAPPGAKKERQKEDDEPEFKFEWQRKYNAPREDYAKGNADIKDQPFGIPVRNVRCIKCHKWGHINTDKECPLFSQASTSSMPTTSMDPMELMKQMREDGYGLKENVLGHHLNPAAANQQLIPSDESDPEMEFLKSLSASEKKKLLRKLKKLSKKQEKASRCKKKKSKKSGRSKSKDKSSDHKKKKSKKSLKSGSSSESGTESSSEESTEEKQKKKKKHSSNRKSKERHSSELSDSELDKPETSKNVKIIQERKDLSKKKHTKSDYLSSQKKVRSISSDNENESKKNKYKNLEHSKSKSATEKKNNSFNNNSESEESERKKVNYFQEEKSGKLAKRFADISSESDQERSFKMSSKHPVYKKSRSPDIITKNHENNRNRGINTEISKNIKTPHTEGSSSEIQEGKSSQRYGEGEKIDNYEKKQNNTDSKLQIAKSNDNYKYDVKLGKHDYESEKNKDQRSNHHITNLKQGDLKRNEEINLNKEKNLKRKTDKGLDSSKQKKRKDDNTNYEEKTKKKNYGECIKTETKNSYSDSNEELSKRKTDKNETSEVKSKKIDLELVEQKRIDDEEPCTSHYKKKKNISDSDEVEKMYDEQKYLDSSKKVDENKMGEEFSSKEKEYMLPDSSEKHDNVSKILSIKQTCNSPSHPDGFSHLCPQAKVQANYVQVDEEYQGKEHDDFRHFNRERRSPSVKQKYNS